MRTPTVHTRHQLVFGFTVGSLLILLALLLDTLGESGVASLSTGILLIALNVTQYLLANSQAGSLIPVPVQAQGGDK